MKRYEYKRLEYLSISDATMAAINQHGTLGWRVVASWVKFDRIGFLLEREILTAGGTLSLNTGV